MPQERRPTAEEVLGLAPRRPTAEEVLGLPPRRPSAEEVLGLAPQPQDDWFTTFRRNVGIAAEQGYVALKDKAAAIGEIVGGAAVGDFRPTIEAAQIAGRGVQRLATSLFGEAALTSPEFGPPTAPIEQVPQIVEQAKQQQDAPIRAIQARQSARRSASGDTGFQQRAQRQAELEAEAQFDPSLSGRITRGVVREGIKLAPTVLAGVVSGGSVPAITAATAAGSLDDPQNLGAATALSALPIPSARAIKQVAGPAVRRLLGRGAEQIIENEAATLPGAVARTAAAESAPTLRAMAPATAGQIRATGAASNAASIRAASPSANLDLAIAEGAKEVPESMTRRVLSEISAFPRAMMSSLDISAPGRQGLLLAVAPSRWGDAVKAGARMFQSFKPKHYDRITKEIANHADAPLAEQSGLYLAFKTPEELFTSRLASKVPGVQASQRGYSTYLDSLRMSTFSQYKRWIDKSGLSSDEALKAYTAAAKWINVATGRGSFGKRFDDAAPFLSGFIFAPRYSASRFNILNPKMYIDNFRDPATRIVAKRQMADLAQYIGLVATTYGLAKAAGADVTLNPSSRDFLKIRAGNKTYDPGAGLVQVMRFAIRASHDMFRAAKGEKSEAFKDAGSLTLNFLRSKTAPLASYVWDFFSRRTYEGKDFVSGKDRAIGAIERVVPIQWADFTESLFNEGIGGALATLPGATGIGVQTITQPGGFLDQAAPLLREYSRASRRLPEIRRIKNESDEQFGARVKVFGEALQQFGVGLVESEEYRKADTATKDKALDLLPRRIGSALMRQGESWQLAPKVLVSDAKDSIQSEQKRGPRQLYDAGGQRLR